MRITLSEAVVAECDDCHERSRPLSRQDAEAFDLSHQRRHYFEDQKRRLAGLGHKITDYGWVGCDDSEVWAVCECSWKSKHTNIAWIRHEIERHFDTIEPRPEHLK